MIRLLPVTPENWRALNALSVREDQKTFVAANLAILARAYAFREYRARALAICEGEKPVGLLMLRDGDDPPCYVLDQFMVDARFQGRGFGREALRQVLELMAREGRYGSVELCYKKENADTRDFYLAAGFLPTGDEDGDEVVLSLDLPHPA